MTSVSIVLTTIDSSKQAEQISETLVTERLAACVNILPAVTSVYSWKNEIHNDTELVLIIKTQTDKLEPLFARLKQLHPYEVPEMIAVPVSSGLDSYLEWVEEQTR